MENNNITNEELAQMIGKGFAGVDEKFAGINEKFAGINEKFTGIDEKFKGVYTRLEKIENILLDSHGRRIEKLEDRMKEPRESLAMK